MLNDLLQVAIKLKAASEFSEDAKMILENIRKDIVVSPTMSYKEILQRRLHLEELYVVDKIYNIFEKEVSFLLEGKSHDEKILVLTQMIMML